MNNVTFEYRLKRPNNKVSFFNKKIRGYLSFENQLP